MDFRLQPGHYGLAVSICGLRVPTRTLWTVLSASVDFLIQQGHYGRCCQHLWTSCSNQHIMNCAVSTCGLPAPTRILWTVLSASVDFLFKPGHCGLCSQHLWTSCSNQVTVDCAVSICGLPVTTSTLWTLLHDTDSNTLCSNSQHTNKQTKLSATVTAVGVLALCLFATATVDRTVNCDEIV